MVEEGTSLRQPVQEKTPDVLNHPNEVNTNRGHSNLDYVACMSQKPKRKTRFIAQTQSTPTTSIAK